MSFAHWKTQNRRVVVTGLGMISPVGATTETTWNALLEGKSGAGPITLFDASNYSVRFACEVKDFNPDLYIPKKEQKKMDRFIHLGIAAAFQAWADAGFKGRAEENSLNPEKLGVIMAAGMGGLPIIEEIVNVIRDKGPSRITPFFIPSVIPNLTSGHISLMLNAKGPNTCIVTACASSSHAIGEAAVLISRGDVDCMIAGGSESVICGSGVGGFAAMKALSTRNDEPQRASRPFDKDRDGFVIGEGGGALILEDYEHAKKRGARIYGEVLGYGSTGDAYHMTAPAPDGEGAGRCMTQALERGKIDPASVDYINAHGTSTPMGDECESAAVERVFGDHAKKLIMSSTKSMTGHLLGGAGGLEAAISLLVMKHGVIPPTINLENPSESCRLNYAANQAVQRKVDVALSNSFGFGGTNASLVFGKI